MTVYFVTEKGNPSGPVKIGVTADLATRLSGLQTAAHVELEIVASIRGGREVESYFHEALEAYRIRGEWFDRSPEVESTIRRVALFGETCLPFRPDRFPRAEHNTSPDIEAAKRLSREIGLLLCPDAEVGERLKAISRRMARHGISVSNRRMRAIYFGEARRIDHLEMTALKQLKAEIEEVRDANILRRITPIAAALFEKCGSPFTPHQKAVLNRLLEKANRPGIDRGAS